jgi:hypothetical protein
MSTLSNANESTTNEPGQSTKQSNKAVSLMLIIDALVAPGSVFTKFKSAKKVSWLALALLLIVTSASSWVFFDNMSTSWLVEQQLLQTDDISPSELSAVKEMMEQTAEYTGLISAVFNVLATLFIGALFSGYYLFATKLVKGKAQINSQPETLGKFSFSDWFSFNVWTQMPLLINSIGFSVLFLTAATTDLPISLVNYASLNQLFLSLAPDHDLFMWAESFNFFYLWSTFIAIVGLQKCCQLSLGKASVVAFIPYFLIFGLWFAIA